jgi:serine protease inhibitor
MQRPYRLRFPGKYALTLAGSVLMSMVGYLTNTSTIAVAQSLANPVIEVTPVESTVPENTLTFDSQLVEANTQFGFKLFEEILKQDAGKNIFVSPLSAGLALTIAYNGASGTTQAAMAEALELQGISLEQVNSSNAQLKTLLENPEPEVELTIANSLWANEDFSFKSEFIQTSQDFYQAQVTNLDFSDPNSPGIINSWVNENTNGKIPQIVNNIKPEDVLFIINAIYFKGSWTREFDKNQTANYPFYLSSGEQKQHPMMSQSGSYRYYENEEFQAVSLPYGESGRLSLYLFLPKQNSSLTAFYESLNAENWEQWMTQFYEQTGFVRLPRFKMEYDISLNEALKALGMEVAFRDTADFSGMSEIGNLFKISEVRQKTFVEVNEEGTEAVAVTGIGLFPVVAYIPPQEPFQMIVDRPFFAAIRDNQTGSILFMGSIEDPQSESIETEAENPSTTLEDLFSQNKKKMYDLFYLKK